MANIEKAFEIRLKKDKEIFEMLIDFEKLNEFRKNPKIENIYDVICEEKIFKDQKKGELANDVSLNKIFKNMNKEQIMYEILIKGECQIPTSYLNNLRESKKTQIINYIASISINPQTKSKYTFSMIEREVNKLKYNINPNTGIEMQSKEILDQLKKIMPIKIDSVKLILEIPAKFTGNFYSSFRKNINLKSEKYDNSGKLILEIETTSSNLDDIIKIAKNKTENQVSYYTL